MQRIRVERRVLPRRDRDRHAPLPRDPRDPDIRRAKELLRAGTEASAISRSASPVVRAL
jgi:hypothetical protein